MSDKAEFLMPDYYLSFACKMGACRTSCCEGWQVSLSMDDYFRLVGMDCPPIIRKELDCALHIIDGGTPDRFAFISNRYDGSCHLRMPDGRCMLHAAMGEDALPLICRLYPRGIRTENAPECSCASSCERIVEMLFFRDEPISFVRSPISGRLPEMNGSSVYSEDIADGQNLRLFYISYITDRRFHLPERIYRLGIAMRASERYVKEHIMPDYGLIGNTVEAEAVSSQVADISERIGEGLSVISEMVDYLDIHSPSLKQYGTEILGYFSSGNEIGKYRSLRKQYEEKYPGWENGAENLLVNHMFFSRFPFSDGNASLYREYTAICAVYTLIRFLSVGSLIINPSDEHTVDILSSAFRLIEHTDFHKTAASILHKADYTEPEEMRILTSL